MTESEFWKRISKKLPGMVKRIENTTERGTPDVYVAYDGRSFWIELKVDSGQGVLVRNEQYVWMHKLHSERVPCYVLAWMEEYCVWKYPFEYQQLSQHKKITSLPNAHSNKMEQIATWMVNTSKGTT